ncbi:hypothetical protein I7I50_07710 [Histoplasma capsulatum G186AR]|uniref:CorA family metal ion transporter n=1 Tax=Ajellomyces capsulatus TaxID=5037 RepID=A0A8H8D315_AJECA|nr:hypothetical protein I7I52_09218 [Histoplasma capsulatum]QSS68338.1 hypothetical protein I7I50_07710 [Histoplasma capsulatum G186AR]
MLQDRSIFNPEKLENARLFASKAEQPHDLVVVYNSREGKWDVQHYSQEQHEDFSVATSVPAGAGQIVFIRGFLSPLWVSAIGSKYRIDPEFFRRHMDFLSVGIIRHSYSLPSLASTSNNIFRLCVSTLLHRDDFGGQDLQSQRSDQSSELKIYRRVQLGSSRVCCGDSLVREYSTVCSRFSVVEQWISFCVTRTDQGWAVIAWMDQGRPLEKSPPGPWISHIKSMATPMPVLQHHPKMAFRTTTNRLDPNANASAEVFQSTAVLPLQYDSLIALVDLARLAPHDPLSMCIPLFAHAAFSEVQFLNLMECKIQEWVNQIAEGVPAELLGSLQYFSSILNRHSQQLKDSSHALSKLAEWSPEVLNGQTQIRISPPRPGVGTRWNTPEFGSVRHTGSRGSFTAQGLLHDYEQLHDRCISLSKTCTRGITLAMNKATIEESRKAIEQSERLKKLTLLATLFIPLTFCSSLLGMNVDLLGQNSVKFWWFFVLCVPVTLFAYIFYLWDFVVLKRCWATCWERWLRIRQQITAGKSKKGESHIV